MTITKKDTIVLAVLLNLVVFVGVFVTARQVLPHSDKKSGASTSFGSEEVKEQVSEIHQEEIEAFDEIDQLLEEYDAKGKISRASELECKPEQKLEQRKSASKRASLPKEGFYIVRPGDNPWKIAKKFHISFGKLLELNQLDEIKAKNLKVGQILCIKEP